MKRNLLILFILLFSIPSFSQGTKMTDAEIKTFTEKISSESKKIQTLQSDFIQTKKMDFLNKDIVTSGKMVLKSPNQLSWKYTKPYQYSVIFKDNKIFINDQGKKSSVDAKSKMFEKINKLIAGTANGNIFSDPEFVVRYFQNGENTVARFIPKSTQLLKYIKQIDLQFNDNQNTVSQVTMLEASGDTTNISFKNTKTNASVSADAFSL